MRKSGRIMIHPLRLWESRLYLLLAVHKMILLELGYSPGLQQICLERQACLASRQLRHKGKTILVPQALRATTTQLGREAAYFLQILFPRMT